MSSRLAAEACLARAAVEQHGVFTRDQARAAGFNGPGIERRVRAGAWVRVLPRVYRHAATPPSRLLLFSAAVRWAGSASALSHTSAAALWRLPGARFDRTELIVPVARSPRAGSVVVHRVARVDAADVVRVRGLAVTAPARTLIDLAAVLPDRDLERALSHAFGLQLVGPGVVERRLAEIGSAGRPGVARLRALLRAIGSGRWGASARMAG